MNATPSPDTAPPLRRLRVEGFKSIAVLDMELRPLNVLIGANGAGKSNLIEVFRFTREIIEERLQRYVGLRGGAERLLHYGSRRTKQLRLHFDFPPNAYRIVLQPTEADQLFIWGEVGFIQFDGDEGPYDRPISFGGAETELQKREMDSLSQSILRVMKEWRIYHFHDVSPNAAVKKNARLNDNAFLFEDAGNLAAFLYLLQERHAAHFARIERTIRQVLPDFGGFELRPNPLNPDTIQLEWRERNTPDFRFTAADFSDGSLRFVCLAALLLQPALPSVLLLDEPELGLHPAAVVILGELLQKAAERTTVLVSTQSAALLSAFAPEDVIVVDREAGASTFRRLEEAPLKEWLTRYSLGELWEKNVFNGGRP